MYDILPKERNQMLGHLIEHFDEGEGERKILILDFIDGRMYHRHKQEFPSVCNYTARDALNYAIQMTNIFMFLEKYDIVYGDFHG